LPLFIIQSDCQRRNANLVKVETAAENEWLKTVAKRKLAAVYFIDLRNQESINMWH
jgi:hypothetical protein